MLLFSKIVSRIYFLGLYILGFKMSKEIYNMFISKYETFFYNCTI